MAIAPTPSLHLARFSPLRRHTLTTISLLHSPSRALPPTLPYAACIFLHKPVSHTINTKTHPAPPPAVPHPARSASLLLCMVPHSRRPSSQPLRYTLRRRFSIINRKRIFNRCERILNCSNPSHSFASPLYSRFSLHSLFTLSVCMCTLCPPYIFRRTLFYTL